MKIEVNFEKSIDLGKDGYFCGKQFDAGDVFVVYAPVHCYAVFKGEDGTIKGYHAKDDIRYSECFIAEKIGSFTYEEEEKHG